MQIEGGRTRAFIAVDVPHGIMEGIIAATSGIKSEGIRMVGADQMHITLFFLDYLDAAQIERVKLLMGSLHHKKFEIRLCGLSSFSTSAPRVLFASISDGADGLISIHDALHDGLAKIAQLDEKGFTPHLTIARLKKFDSSTVTEAMDLIKRHRNDDFGSFACCGVKLKQSVLTRSGAQHSDIFDVTLDG